MVRGDKIVHLTQAIVVGLVLSVAPTWAKDFSAELDFVTRASNSNLFAIEESRLALVTHAASPR